MFVFAVFTGRLCAYKRPVNICMGMFACACVVKPMPHRLGEQFTCRDFERV